ncbi:hypothetical protein K4H00_26000, partial [Mycobacterium tuberculosis]|nr:hypothetical protein [Mycobacterium tuberculosis]
MTLTVVVFLVLGLVLLVAGAELLVRGAARLYALGAEDHPAGRPVNAAIYYGLGVTEHAQGSTMVMGIANLAMA